jgi:thioredoxin reductase
MTVHYAIAIVGGGPAGISAAVHAARRGVSHVLLERKSRLYGAVHEFPKSKPVMAAPATPLLSDLPFAPGSRETVIAAWAEVVQQTEVNFRLNAEVTNITGSLGNFEIRLADGDTIRAEYVVMAVGLNSNCRKLTVPGAEVDSRVQYRIDDPEEIEGEDIVVVGKGDSAIEDALALADRNQVSMVYRGNDFSRVQPSNARRLRDALRRGVIQAYAHSEPQSIQGDRLLIQRAA